MIKRICQTCGYTEFIKDGVPTFNEDGTESYNTEYVTLNECMKCCGHVKEKEDIKIPSVKEAVNEDNKDAKVEENAEVEEKEPDIKIEGIKTVKEEAGVGEVQELPVDGGGEPGITPEPDKATTEAQGSKDTTGPEPAAKAPNTNKDRKPGAGNKGSGGSSKGSKKGNGSNK